jgi:hypothetical protein
MLTEQYYVGYGGFPNAEGEMELDAAIMCGSRKTYGGVAALQVRVTQSKTLEPDGTTAPKRRHTLCKEGSYDVCLDETHTDKI